MQSIIKNNNFIIFQTTGGNQGKVGVVPIAVDMSRLISRMLSRSLGKLTEDDGKYVEEIRLEGEKKLKIQAIINREIVDETSNLDEIDVVDEEEVEGIFFFEQFDEDD